MRVFLNGGGDGANAQEAYQRFGAAIDKTKPLLYIPMAMEKEDAISFIAEKLTDKKVVITVE